MCHILHEVAPLVCLETSVKQNSMLTKNIQNWVYYEPDKNCCTYHSSTYRSAAENILTKRMS